MKVLKSHPAAVSGVRSLTRTRMSSVCSAGPLCQCGQTKWLPTLWFCFFSPLLIYKLFINQDMTTPQSKMCHISRVNIVPQAGLIRAHWKCNHYQPALLLAWNILFVQLEGGVMFWLILNIWCIVSYYVPRNDWICCCCLSYMRRTWRLVWLWPGAKTEVTGLFVFGPSSQTHCSRLVKTLNLPVSRKIIQLVSQPTETQVLLWKPAKLTVDSKAFAQYRCKELKKLSHSVSYLLDEVVLLQTVTSCRALPINVTDGASCLLLQ